MTIQNFAHYKTIKLIGKGGMGEVFLVEDSKLSRKVALKFLSPEAVANRERLHRFELEAHVISALNHPNILTIYEIGEFDGRKYIATEFVEGETLREHLTHKSDDLQKTLEIAVQIAAALETAHENGIIHRDIKPENIMIRRDGLVKILDFGLAKLVGKAGETIALVDAEAPTRADLSTAPGLVMGTSFYLSPEQARGKKVDCRTDIWSFGVILYEAVTGNYPFKGETASDVIASILKTEHLPLTAYAPNAPAELQRIVKKTLRKDCEERYQSVKDLLLDLKNLIRKLNSYDSEFPVASTATQVIEANTATYRMVGVSTKPQTAAASDFGKTPNRLRLFPAIILLGLLLLIFIGGWYVWRNYPLSESNSNAPLAVTQAVIWKNDLGEKMINRARFSPDGKFIAFSSTKNGNRDIWLKQVSGGDAMQLTKDSQSSASPIWSADGGQIALLSERGDQKGIWKMPALGGAMTLLKPLDSLNYNLVHWSKDGKTIYYSYQKNFYALDIASQQAARLTNFTGLKFANGDFRLSPDEESFAYFNGDESGTDIWIMKKSGGEPKRLTNDSTDDSSPVWMPDGSRIVYNSTRNNVKQICLAFTDARPPIQLSVNNNDGSILDVPPDGTKILFASERDEADLWGVKLETGKEFQITSDLELEMWADISPDNNSIAFQTTNLPNANNLIKASVMKKPFKSDSQSVTLAEDGFATRWSPDGKQLAFLRGNDDGTINHLWLVGNEGGNARQLTNSNVTFGGNSFIVPYNLLETQDYQWSPDGKSLIFCANKSGVSNVWQINADGANETMLSANTEPNLVFSSPMLSPDGQRVAWLSLLPGKKMTRSVWITETGKSRAVYQSDSLFHIIGWSAAGNELIIKSLAGVVTEPQVTKDVDLFSLTLDGLLHPLAQLAQTHFQNIKLSPDRKQIAFVSRAGGMGNLQIMPANGGTTKTIVTGNDARVYFSNLVWSPDGKTIYYGKQASWSVLSMIENFK